MLDQSGRHYSVNTRDARALVSQVPSKREVNFLLEFILLFTTKQYKNTNIAKFVKLWKDTRGMSGQSRRTEKLSN